MASQRPDLGRRKGAIRDEHAPTYSTSSAPQHSETRVVAGQRRWRRGPRHVGVRRRWQPDLRVLRRPGGRAGRRWGRLGRPLRPGAARARLRARPGVGPARAELPGRRRGNVRQAARARAGGAAGAAERQRDLADRARRGSTGAAEGHQPAAARRARAAQDSRAELPDQGAGVDLAVGRAGPGDETGNPGSQRGGGTEPGACRGIGPSEARRPGGPGHRSRGAQRGADRKSGTQSCFAHGVAQHGGYVSAVARGSPSKAGGGQGGRSEPDARRDVRSVG